MLEFLTISIGQLESLGPKELYSRASLQIVSKSACGGLDSGYYKCIRSVCVEMYLVICFVEKMYYFTKMIGP